MNVRRIFQKKYIRIAKYVGVALLFVVWVGFLDTHNFREQLRYRSKIEDLKEEQQYYLEKIKEDSIRLHELNTDDENLEKYAREKYLMKKKGEEIFLVNKKKEE